MFVSALKIAAAYTFPYVGLRRRANGEVFSVVASCIVLNRDGWIATSAHIVDEILAWDGHLGVADGPRGDDEVQPHIEIWAVPGFETARPRLTTVHVNRVADLAVGRLEPFDSGTLDGPPILRDTSKRHIEQGENVCRLGFPFHSVEATYIDARKEFEIVGGAFPVPRFALDGIVARFNLHQGPDGASATFIETSTPGLRGQSGGPLLDVEGRVCGVQSHTAHLDLGFDARYLTAESTSVVERQFLNVGGASHVDELRALLDSKDISYQLG